MMNTEKRRGGYLATAEGVKKLKEAKRIKKYTYEQIKDAANVTLDQVKRLFNPEWGNHQYGIHKHAVSLICGVLDLKPEEIVNYRYGVLSNFDDSITADLTAQKIDNINTPYNEALQIIKQAANDRLGELDLAGIKLTKLPSEIRQLENLTVLYLNRNSLSSLPAEIGQLNNLQALFVGKNLLRSLPPEIGQLTNLKILYLNSNFLNSLPPEIGQLRNLESLYLNSNSLNSLPPEIGQLRNLESLYLNSNSLNSLPPEIGQLRNLKSLYLNSNSLNSLPPEIGQLSNFTKLYLNDNSLPIPPEVIDKYHEPSSIINYYLSLQSNQLRPLHEAKMLLVGQGNVGKTCVRERLIRNKYDPRRNKTDGIDIETWKIEINQCQYQINVWDFGGQEIMHSTHQFFLTKRSLYLLVVDTTLGEEENRIEYWLKIIQSFGKDSPVIIVGNKADQHPLDIDQRGLQRKYPQIRGFYEISCQEETGIADLKAKVTQEIIQLEHIDDQLPLPWFNVKQKLERLEQDYIPYERYESICKSEEINQEDNQRILIKLLNDLGVVLNFQDDLRLKDTHVLNPEWVTNGVYKILNDHQLIVEHKGILELKMLQQILKRDRYPTSKHLFIIDMMRKFELCFDIETNKKFLMSDIVPKEEPYTGKWDDTLAFEYHYPVLPGSIISRFIVRMNHWIHKKTYWRSGVVLANEGNTALVKADREDKKIFIRINGEWNTRRDLLAAIRSQFDSIHSTIPGIIPTERVPLLDYPNIPPINYKWLVDLENKNIKTIIPTGLTKEINVKQLLNGISSEKDRRSRNSDKRSESYSGESVKMSEKKMSNEVFISYSCSEESKKITDKLDAAFQAKGITIVRDIRDVRYKGQFKAFMENIGRGKCVIVVISKAYLESENCMFELLQIFKDGEFSDRIFPIVLPDAKIYKPKDRIKYVQYWEQEVKELDAEMKSVSAANLQGFTEDINLYTEIRNSLPQLTNILRDINALTIKIHSESDFLTMIEAVSEKLKFSP